MRKVAGIVVSGASFLAGVALTSFVPEWPQAVVRLVSQSSGANQNSAEASVGAEVDEAPPLAVVVAIAREEAVSRTITAIGDTVATESVVLTPRVAGIVEATLFEGGEAVEAGTLLLRLDPAEVEGALAVAEAEVQELRGTFERAQQLAADGTGPQAVADDLQRRTQAAEAAVDSARERLASFEIRAPFAGRLGLRTVSVGALVQPGDEIVKIDAVDPINVRFAVPERFLADARPDARVTARSAAYASETFEGSVTVVEPQVDPVLRTVRVEARLPNPGGRLVPGKLLAVELTLGVDEDAIVVPALAVRTEGSVQFVFRDADGTAERVNVATGQRLADRIVVTEGLAVGDRVVTEGLVELADGDPIASQEEEFPAHETAMTTGGG